MKQYEELFINGERVNIGDTNITLEWKSVILSDISKYVASHSYTIKLPMTVQNRKVFGGVEMLEKGDAENDGLLIGKRMSARYYCNGVDLLGDANAYLTGIEKGFYQVVLTWGSLQALETLKDEDRTIPEFLVGDSVSEAGGFIPIHSIPYQKQYNSFISTEFLFDVLALEYDNGVPQTKYIGQLPSVKATWILGTLFDRFGIKYDFNGPDGKVDELLDSLYCPITTLNDAASEQYSTTFKVHFGATRNQDDLSILLASKFENIHGFYSNYFFNSRVAGLLQAGYGSYYSGWVGGRELMKYKIKTHIRVFVLSDTIDTETRAKSLDYATAWCMQKLTLDMVNGSSSDDMASLISLKPTYISDEWLDTTDSQKAYIEVRYEYDEYQDVNENDTPAGEWEEEPSLQNIIHARRARRFIVKGSWNSHFYSSPAYEIDCPALKSRSSGNAPESYSNWVEVVPVLTEGSYIEPYSDEKLTGASIYLEPNLPEMKPVDFLKGVLRLTGMFPYNIDGTVHFARYGQLTENIGKAPDWSRFLINGEDMPQKISLTMSNFNRKNWMRYKDDSEDNPKYSGFFSIDNDKLGAEDDLFTLPFSCFGANESGLMKVPVYESGTVQTSYTLPIAWMSFHVMFFKIFDVEDVPGYVFKDCKPLIGRRVKSSYWTEDTTTENTYVQNLDKLSFEGLSFADEESEVRKRYDVFAKILEKPYQITVTLDLDEITLRDLDMSVPVFLRQYANYFAIVSIKRKSDGLCTAELLRIPGNLINNTGNEQ